MRVLAVHNRYLQPGGEDQVFAAECALLEDRGHEVIRFTRSNEAVADLAGPALLGSTLWNHRAYRELRGLFRRHRTQVVHLHNTLPLVSPSAYYAAAAEGVAVVQTLHNYRLSCPNGLFFRGGRVCEDCLGKAWPWPSVRHRCYRESRGASGAVTAMLGVHRAFGTWSRRVDVYVALTSFSKQKFVEAGLPAEKLVVKPNFVFPDPGPGRGEGGCVLFVGRLSAEKGIDTLLDALRRLDGKVSARIVGDGPLADRVARAAEEVAGLSWLGARSLEETCRLMGSAALLVVPSEWYENFPRVVVEALAKGTPIVAARLGALDEIVEDGRFGLHFRYGDAEDLARQLAWATDHPDRLSAMRLAARAEYESKYTADRNYATLLEIYRQAIHTHARNGG